MSRRCSLSSPTNSCNLPRPTSFALQSLEGVCDWWSTVALATKTEPPRKPIVLKDGYSGGLLGHFLLSMDEARKTPSRFFKVAQSQKGCAFFGVPKSFFLDTKDQCFLGYKAFFGIQNAFFGIQKIVLDIFGGPRGLINCLIVIDILEGRKRQRWEERGVDGQRPKSSNKHKQQQQEHK